MDKNKNDEGFTLLELLVVMVIMVLLIGIIGPRVLGSLGGARSGVAQLQLSNIETSLDLFLLDVGKYPTTEQGLMALVKPPKDIKKRWYGPYLGKQSGLTDPWGNLYIYVTPGKHGIYDLYSFGKDKLEGGEGEDEDIANWD